VDYRGDVWGELRTMRANSPGQAAEDGARRAVFLAALEQSEQLLRGARQLGYASRPLSLFYGLSQAGRAISAAWCSPSEGRHQAWRLSGHGINAKPLNGDLDRIKIEEQDISRLRRADKARPSFPGVASVLGSEHLLRPVSFVDLWACLPEAIGRPAPGDDGRFGPLQIQHPTFPPDQADTYVAAVLAWTHNWPINQMREWLDAGGAVFNSRIHTTILTKYPTLNPPASPPEHGWPTGWFGRRGSARLIWHLGEAVEMIEADLTLMLQETPYRDEHWIFPAVAGQQVHPLMAWWAVLYTLSMLARYEPERWVSIVDVDHSEWATPLEHLLDHALDAVPEVICQALTLAPAAIG
jgi:hypothetical protein